MIRHINFEYGIFKHEEIALNSVPLIKGKFYLYIHPDFPKEFERTFWFYNLSKRLKIDDVISLGPYFPMHIYYDNLAIMPDLKYPAFSDIILNSKSGPLHRAQNDYIRNSRKEQLKIISNFYAYYLKEAVESLDYDEIIPVPAKSMYSFNSIEIICKEFSKIFNIPINVRRIKRINDGEKDYAVISKNNYLNLKNILIIDDIITDGITKAKIFHVLKEAGCYATHMITLAKTDHNIYEYND